MDILGAPLVEKRTRLLVCGGRAFADHALLVVVLDQYLKAELPKLEVLIHGDAPGADRAAAAWALASGVPVLPFPAAWETYGRAAGPLRNQRMLDEGHPSTVIAFPGGSGTRDMVRKACTAQRRRLVEHVFVVERCDQPWWTDPKAVCATCARQGFHVVEARRTGDGE